MKKHHGMQLYLFQMIFLLPSVVAIPATFCSGSSGRFWRKVWCNFQTSVFALLLNLLVDLCLICMKLQTLR